MNAAAEQILVSKIRTLSPQQVSEVEDFVEFLTAKARKRSALDRLLAIAPALQAAGVAPMSEDEIASVPRVVGGDIDDDHVIAAAVAARADLLVSGDRKHLLPLDSHQGIDIVDAIEALRRITAGT